MGSGRVEDIVTRRLALIAITPESAASEKANDGRLGEITGAVVPGAWPPEHWEPHVLDLLLQRFEADAEEVGWHRYIAMRDGEDGPGRRLIGTLGGFRRAERPGECEVGYSVLPEFQGRGYATEGMQAFVAWAFRDDEMKTVVAQTFPALGRSVRVMEKLGMAYVGAGYEEGTVLYRMGRGEAAHPG